MNLLNSGKTWLKYSCLGLPGLLLTGAIMAQDHSGHGQAEPVTEHQHLAGQDQNQEMSADMSHEMTMQEQSLEPRDPHAYSGGYRRDSGPYTLPESQQNQLADEAILAGLWIDRLEARDGMAEDFEEFDGYVWLGNSYQRWKLRSELERRDQTVEESKTELLYSRAISPFWDLELGGRYDHGDKEHRKWFALGVTGLAPYWIEVGATFYIGPNGHSAATVEMEYDLNLTQRLVLQPKLEVDFYGDSDLAAGHGKGLSKSLMGLRLRYDFDRQFGPYIGYERVHRHGETVGIFEPLGQHREAQWIAGFRLWF